MKKLLYVLLALAAIVSCKGKRARVEEPVEVPVVTEALDTVVYDIVTTAGTMKVRLYKDTPLHKANFEKLVKEGYYDSLLFHRVINGFMIQGGDPYTRDTSKVAMYGQGGPEYTIPAEMRDSSGAPLHRHAKGALAAARRGDLANPFKESSGSQFYIVQSPEHCIHLDGEYTVFGQTVAGLNVIDKIAGVKTDRMDRPVSDIRIISIKPEKTIEEKPVTGTEFAEN